METSFTIPKYIAVAYDFNPQTGYFQKSVKQPSTIQIAAMPFELKREITRADQIKCNAPEVLRIGHLKNGNGNSRILTGIIPLEFKHWHVGNHFDRGKKSLILFYFYPDNDKMLAFYFSGYDRASSQLRQQFAAQAIPLLKKNHSL